MGTSVDFINYVMEAISGIGGMEFRYRKMFGEYCVYVNDKPIFLVCDNTVYVKMLPCIEALMSSAERQPPFEGAKPHYLLDIDDHRMTEQVIRLLEPILPLPKARQQKLRGKS